MKNTNIPTNRELPSTAKLIKSTAIAAEQTKTGELVAAFDGSHGWFWRNRTTIPVTITLKTKGEYTEIIQK